MANKDYQLNLKMRADFAQAQAELRKAQGSLEKVIGTVNTANLRGQVAAGAMRATAAGMTTLGIASVAIMAKYIANTVEAEKVQAQLAARIKDTGAAAGRTLDQLGAQAEKVQSLTIFDDEAIGGAQAMLLTFKQIQGVQFDKATEAAADLATVMGTDIADAAKLLGKALNDPEKGLAALTKAGITFTAGERDQIEKMLEANNVAGAQDVILNKLSGTMGTAAEAARNTLGGAAEALKNSFDNLLEGDSGDEGVEGVREAIESLIKTLNDPSTKAGFNAMIADLAQVANFAAQAIAAVGGLSQAVKDALSENAKKSRDGLLSRRADLADDLADLDGGLTGNAKLILGGRSGKVGFGPTDEIKRQLQAEIAQIDSLLRVQSSLVGKFDPNFRPGRITVTQRGQGQFANVLGTGEIAPAGHAPTGGDEDKKKTGSKSDPDSDIKRRIESLKEERTLLAEVKDGEDKASEAARVRYAITEGEFKTKSPALKQLLLEEAEALDAARAAAKAEEERKEKLEETKEAYEDLRDELRTPAEAALDEAIKKVETLNAAINAGVEGSADYKDQALARIVKDAVGEGAPKFDGLSPEVGGPFSELNRIEQAREKLQAWYEERLQVINAGRAKEAELKAQWDAQELETEAEHQAALRQLQSAQTQVMLAGASHMFDNLAGLAKSFGGEQSKTYRALFALSKGFAVAQAAVALAQNVSEASKVGFPYNIPFIAGAFAQGASIAALLSQANFGGSGYAAGGYTGPGGKFEPAGTVHKGEGVLTQEEIAALGGPAGFYDLRELIQDGRMRERMYGWAGYADGGMVAPRPALAAPEWGAYPQGGIGGATVNNALRVYLSMNEDQLIEQLSNHPKFEKKVVAVASQNGRAITAEW